MDSPSETRRAHNTQAQNSAVTLIVYIYWRGVQSWDSESVTRGDWPSEMVSWHIKGVEYELTPKDDDSTTFEMLPEQVGFAPTTTTTIFSM